ncbi:SPOR domain-containing protein [Epibacterium sp. Ofav1-8]|uniref:SPOR domain-containing protein n=1 Tax=Epibacterium sp. Ofav1-8 TaxID=2917735 RepID=UPI001EF3F32E|nr:SPOR domain-containing protein [Epibacterium sp. Ofav1-8]MCG7622337.1 SPOR domain-containing protein [Epibacterium sp. Ofav1-8]
MKITRITAVSLIWAVSGGAGLYAQTIQPIARPAEVPPASFEGRQFVDSKGCVFIRAGVDGNVAWIPRVNRARQQLCGATPTEIAGARPAAEVPPSPAPEVISLAPGTAAGSDAASAPAASAATSVAPVTPVVKPQRAAESTSAAQTAVNLSPVRPARPVSAPRAPTSGTRPAVVPVARPQTAAASADPLSRITPNTRILPVHIYLERRKSEGLQVPEGYRVVWEDDRLNIHRAEQTIRPTVLSDRMVVPDGYAPADRADNRMNAQRGVRTPQGDAQMAQVWSEELPRRQVERPLDKTPFVLWDAKAKYGIVPPRRGGTGSAISSRSAPDATLPEAAPVARRYVRAATLSDPAEARRVARDLASATGLQMRLGTLKRNGQTYKVVLAGPFTVGAQQALHRIRAAGFSGARLSK